MLRYIGYSSAKQSWKQTRDFQDDMLILGYFKTRMIYGGVGEGCKMPISPSQRNIQSYWKYPTSYTLMVQSAHVNVQHNETLAEVQMKFWIIGGRSLFKHFIYRCVTCRRFEGLPYLAPPALPLPSFQVNKTPLFSYTAVDYAGPIHLEGHKGIEGNKIWICLFTCGSYSSG